MKDKKDAKIGGRVKAKTQEAQEDVAIEYIELTTTDAADQHWVQTGLLRTNHGVVEAAGKCCQDLVGKNRAALESYIVQCEESGVDVSLRSLVGVNRLRFSFPDLDAKLVLPKQKMSE